MLGDVAVAVHPEDERYRHLVGKRVALPLDRPRRSRSSPTTTSTASSAPACVKVTPAHDFNDYAVGQRHGLPLIAIFTLDAKINDNAPATYRGLDRFDARKAVVADLEAQGLLESRRSRTSMMVPRCERTGQVVEPMLTDQWFVAMTQARRADGTLDRRARRSTVGRDRAR